MTITHRPTIAGHDWDVSDYSTAATADYVASELPNVPTALRAEFATAANATATEIGSGLTGQGVVDYISANLQNLFWGKTGTGNTLSDGTGTSIVDNDPVGLWLDLITGTTNLFQDNSSSRPILEDDVGQGWINTNGDSIFLKNFSGDLLGTSQVGKDIYIFFGVEFNSITHLDYLLDTKDASPSTDRIQLRFSSSVLSLYSTVGNDISTGTLSIDTPYIIDFNFFYDGTATGNVDLYLNGSLIGSDTTLTASQTMNSNKVTLASDGSTATRSGEVDLAVFAVMVDPPSINRNLMRHFTNKLSGLAATIS